MNLHGDGKAPAERPAPPVETAIDRCYLDCLVGRGLPPEDHLAVLFDGLDRTAIMGETARPYPGRRRGSRDGGPPLRAASLGIPSRGRRRVPRTTGRATRPMKTSQGRRR